MLTGHMSNDKNNTSVQEKRPLLPEPSRLWRILAHGSDSASDIRNTLKS